MFEQLIKQVVVERDILMDKCTKKLIEYVGISVPDNPSNFEIIMLLDDMKRNDYKIKHEFTNSIDKILLVRNCDFYEEIVTGFEILIKVEDLKVSIVAEPIKIDVDARQNY